MSDITKELIQEINGIKYILINDIATYDYALSERKEKCKILEGIFLGTSDRKLNFFGDVTEIKFSVLIPIENAKFW
jgi:hypothetical protein